MTMSDLEDTVFVFDRPTNLGYCDPFDFSVNAVNIAVLELLELLKEDFLKVLWGRGVMKESMFIHEYIVLSLNCLCSSW